MSPIGGTLDPLFPQRKQVGRRTVRRKSETEPSQKPMGKRTPRWPRPLSPPPSSQLKDSRVELMNVSSQRRVGIAVKMMLMRLDVDDGLALPLMGLREEDFDKMDYIHPRGYDQLESTRPSEEMLEYLESISSEESTSVKNELAGKESINKNESNKFEMDYDEDIGISITSPDNVNTLKKNKQRYVSGENVVDKTISKIRNLRGKNTAAVLVEECYGTWIRLKVESPHQLTETYPIYIEENVVRFIRYLSSLWHIIIHRKEYVENDETNKKLLKENIETLLAKNNHITKVTLAQNGSAVSITLGDDSLKLIGHPQNNSSNWFLIPFINRDHLEACEIHHIRMILSLITYPLSAKIKPRLHTEMEGLEPEPASLQTNNQTMKPHVNPVKLKNAQLIETKVKEGKIQKIIDQIELVGYMSQEQTNEHNEIQAALKAAEYVICAVIGCNEVMHRDKFYDHVQNDHQDIKELSDYVFYNENLQITNLDYFKTCGSCTVCGWLFLSQGLISWERINQHFEDEHPDTILQPSAKIKQFDIAKVIKGKKRGRGRPPQVTLTPPIGAIHVGDEVYMVRTGTGPNGQPSYTPMNMAEHGGKPLTGKFAKKFEDEGFLESPAKKKKLDTVIESIVGTDSLPRISNRIKKKTSKAKATHFLNELDESEWLSDNETNFLEDNTLADAMAASDTKDLFAMEENAELIGTETAAAAVTDDKKTMAMGDMNKLHVKDLVYFFNLYLGYENCKKILKSVEDKRKSNQAVVYKSRDVLVQRTPLPSRDEKGAIINQQYCCRIQAQDLEPILEQELGPIFFKQTLVAQQYSYINSIRCTEKVQVYQFENQPELTVAAKTYTFTSNGEPHDLVNIVVRNNVDEEGEDEVPGLKPTLDENLMAKEVKMISTALSAISCRDIKPRFDERGLIMSQKYCCNKTLADVLTDFWQGFLELTQLKEIKLSSEKLKLKRRIPINGTEAMPEKKLYKGNLDIGGTNQQSLEVDFTYFNTSEGSLNLTFICVQWIRKGVKVESDLIDLPSMTDFDSLTVYRRRTTKESLGTHKSFFKSSEISFQDCVKVLVNNNCVPRNQGIFTLQNKGRVVAELRSYLGMFHPTRSKPAELYIGGYKYAGRGSAYRRTFDGLEYDILVWVTHYKFDRSYTDSSCPEDMPQSFSHAEINWVNKPVKGSGSNTINARTVDDSIIPYYPKPASIRRNYRYKCDPEMYALNERIGTRAIANRLKILNRNKSSATRPGMQTINNLYNRKPKEPTIEQDEVSVAVQGISGDGDTATGKRKKLEDDGIRRNHTCLGEGDTAAGKRKKRKKVEDDDEEAELKCFKDQLLSFDSLIRFPKSITYNKKQENGMVMVKNCKRLLYALVGSTTEVNPGWSPMHLEVETYEPSLTNAHMVLSCFSVPMVLHRQRKTPKVCLGPICLSASKSEEDASILGEHMRYNNENVTRIGSMAAMNDELYHSLRNGLKAFSSVFLYDESNVLNSATNRAKCQKHALKLSEVALSHEIGAISVSWEVYMDKIIGLKHESDLVDLLLSLEEGEEYVMMDEECKRLFQLTELEKSQLDEEELRYYELEFFEYIGTGKYPEISWRDYVMQKVSFNPTTPNQVFHSKAISELDFETWNSDQSYDNQFFGNIILQKGTLPKQQYNKIGKKKRLAGGNKGGAAGSNRTAAADKSAEESATETTVYTTQAYTTTIEENPAVFTAFDRVVVDGTFMI